MKRNDFTEFFKAQMHEGDHIGRVTRLTHGLYTVVDDEQERNGEVSGRFHHTVEVDKDYPAVGDWVVFEPYDAGARAKIHRVLDRQTVLSRKKAGGSHQEQIIAANVGTVFIVTALTQEFNLRRIERYVQQIYESGASPVVVLTKRDLCDTVPEHIAKVESVAPGVPVYAVDSLTGTGMKELVTELRVGDTISLVGSSGVGKSTLINHLLGMEKQATQGVREEDQRGRHTTTHRELFELPNGTYIIDTPGMRELQLWGGDEEGVDQTFSDIDRLSASCKFRDCKHEREPGCAVQQAIDEGELDVARLKSYNKLKRELKRLELKDRYGTHRTNRMLHGPNAIK
ncbi:ribosome small subunit-dependent GTPase A [Halobacillus sp. Nhm2S1]|uniref:ribosome small subunit-dependent GTPase A n=1 Tax=Halobacillus sp. Nhm2S1 TaxID=2866716 RepID=UPI001C73C33F|nr:ribosome small subunit-dependent GTPase A [Halobacillus sp. Nhm2S1]MBX0356702.1 ribosome small subunit-dependent GTPase A [Halobacillus sp. Nhm2S1]